MAVSRATYAPNRAEVYFKALEQLLSDLGFLLTFLSGEMLALAKEYRRDFRRSRLLLDPKMRKGELLPTALYWQQLCRVRNDVIQARLPGFTGPKYEKLYIPRKKLTRDFIYLHAREVGRVDLILEYDRRAFILNDAYHEVRKKLMSFESALISRGDRRRWECGDIVMDAPLITLDLRPRSKEALGAAWLYLLRAASLECELALMAERYNADPAYDGLSLSFSIDADHPYGRVCWLGLDGRLPRLDHSEGAREILTDKVMRQLHIGEADRRALSRHEHHRRGMARLHKRYTSVLGGIHRDGRKAIADADAGVLASHPRLLNAG